jgi:DNA replication and repair protein RecF
MRGRLQLADRLEPVLRTRYNELAGVKTDVDVSYETDWSDHVTLDTLADDLRRALATRRTAELDRGITLVGPHRDELRLTIAGLEARQQASQGEQRTLALALRLAGHDVVSELTDTAPVLLLDDVFSELDDDRRAALVAHLPPGQALLTTASDLPDGLTASTIYRVRGGEVVPEEE